MQTNYVKHLLLNRGLNVFLEALVWVCSAYFFAGGHEEETARSLEEKIRIIMLEQQFIKSWEKFTKDFCSVPFATLWNN